MELSSLSRLSTLTLQVSSDGWFKENFVFPELQRYVIFVNNGYERWQGLAGLAFRTLEIKKLSSSLSELKNLFYNVEELRLEEVNELTYLRLESWDERKTPVFSDLIILDLNSLPDLERIWELESSCSATATLQNLKEVTIEDCHKLKVIFPPCLAQSMLQLQKLYIYNCNGLEQVIGFAQEKEITENHYPLCCPQLKAVEITGCERLKYVFSTNTLSRGLLPLESVELWDCPQLIQVFRPTEERDIIGHRFLLNLPSLRKLTVINCPKLECFIVQSQQMEELVLNNVGSGCQLCRIGNQDCMVVGNHEEVFQVQGGLYSFSSIKVVNLQNLCEVRIIWKDLGGVVTLDNLTTLCLCDCKRLRYVFTPSTARSLSRLVNLYITTCEELEGIILGMDQVPSSSNALQPITFPNLTHIEVKKCNNLKSLLPLGSATSLQQLKHLEVESNMKLEQLFEAKEEIKFDKLKMLELADMPCLIDFCPKGYHFVFSSLEGLGVRRCPKMTAGFFIDSKQIVHYKTEKETSETTPNAIHDKNIYWGKGEDMLRSWEE
ncbi:hypothetical protein GQ457_09G023310 [Hibiscus cannabinus]